MKIKRTERGWAGHFICSDRCLFRRNTLLEYGKIKIVVSTVGNMADIHSDGYPNKMKTIQVGCGRYYETMAFHSNPKDERYHDLDVNRQVSFDSEWAIDHLDADDNANDMHERVVDEISQNLKKGFYSDKVIA